MHVKEVHCCTRACRGRGAKKVLVCHTQALQASNHVHHHVIMLAKNLDLPAFGPPDYGELPFPWI
jgi:hypothetical protein